jgi:protein-tyrosine phosphatase
MTPKLYFIEASQPGRLAISGRPRGGDWLEDEVKGWRMAGIETVVSLLTPDEIEELGLSEESRLSAEQGIRFVNLPIPDRGLPTSSEKASRVVSDVFRDIQRGRTVAIHCRQGIGRSGMIAAALLVEQGKDPIEAITLVTRARGLTVPETPEQRDWVLHRVASTGVVKATSIPTRH